eukprot:SAG31_NODE_5606_length_2426_cov_1.296089_3_plen_80_part_00
MRVAKVLEAKLKHIAEDTDRGSEASLLPALALGGTSAADVAAVNSETVMEEELLMDLIVDEAEDEMSKILDDVETIDAA